MPKIVLTDQAVDNLRTRRAQVEIYDAAFSVGGSFGVRVSKTGRKAFFVVYSLHGKRKRMTIGNYPIVSVDRARGEALAAVLKASEGFDACAEYRTYKSTESFRDVAALFVSQHLLAKRAKTTAQEYQRILAKELLPLWGDRKAHDISSQEITRFLEHIASNRGAPVLAARVRAVAGSVFKFAKQKGLVRENPVRTTESPTRSASREHVLSYDEIHRLFYALEKEAPDVRAMISVMLLTGQRLSTVQQMRWRDIRIDEWHLASPGKEKNAQKRKTVIHLVPQVIQALREMESETPDSDLIFSKSKSGNARRLVHIVRRLNDVMKCDVRWNLLDLYRTFQASLAKLGVRPDVIDVIQQRRSYVRGSRYSDATFDYTSEIRTVLQQWVRVIIPAAPAQKQKKVVPLFRI